MVASRDRRAPASRQGLKISWRRAGQWIDHSLLARWAVQPAR
jgi:hypothetical protein